MPKPPAPEVFAEPTKRPFLDAEFADADRWRAKMRARLTKGPLRHASPVVQKQPDESKLHLVIGDSHAHPDFSLYRYDWLGRMITAVQPDVVIDIGDSADMPSLFGYEKGARGPLFEGRAYWQDVEAYIQSRERIKAQLDDYYRGRRKPPIPRLLRLLGNHEDRIDRVIVAEPRFRGVIGTSDLLDAEFGWEVVPFLEPVDVGGLSYSHYFRAPGSGDRPIGGVMQTRAVAVKRHRTSVFGHSHRLGLHEEHDGRGGRITVVNAGCYFERDQAQGQKWARDDIDVWNAGILTLRVLAGQIESVRWYTIDEVRRTFA